ncbi:MAG: hypothetical protein M1825_003767 [Sarcosagium campestre]|nr:MAG: hypothetical protein M1825_003767 [Sarcosagium campestre]
MVFPTIASDNKLQLDRLVNTKFAKHDAHHFDAGNLLALALLLLAFIAVYNDYQAFLKLGPGGTPHSFVGYLRITMLRLFAHRKPCDPSGVPIILRPERGYLYSMSQDLPYRIGRRPRVTGIAPHRQVTQKGLANDFAALGAGLRDLVELYPSSLALGTSCFEKHGTGLFSLQAANRTCNGEVCHAHQTDGSLHMTLHPDDVRLVLERGWGERHPLAKGGWLSRFVPSGFVMIYAPRDANELKVVMTMVKAAIWWVDGGVMRRESHQCRI